MHSAPSAVLEPIESQLAACHRPDVLVDFLYRHRLLAVADLLAERGLLSDRQLALVRPLMPLRGRVPDAQMQAECRVLEGLSSAGVPTLVLKGALLGHLVYPRPEQRWRTDLDILVAEAALPLARDVLDTLGYGPSWATPIGIPGRQEAWSCREPSAHHVDLHWGLRNHPILRDRLGFDEQWASAVTLAGFSVQVYGQCPVHALLGASMHWFDNLFGLPRPLVWLLDKDLLWRQMSPNERGQLFELADEKGLAGLLSCSLAMSRQVWSTPIDEPAIQQLARVGAKSAPSRLARVRPGSLASLWFSVVSEPTWTGRRRRLLRSLLPPAAHMRERYPEGSRLGLAGLYVRRFWRRLRPGGDKNPAG